MVIKQLEDNDRSFYLKTGLLALLLIVAFIVGTRKYNFQKDNRQVLGKEFEFAKGKDKGGQEIADIKEKSRQFIKKTTKNGEKIVGQILGETSKVIDQTASKSAETVNNIIFQNTIKKVIDQIDKLPKSQKEKVIEDLCNKN